MCRECADELYDYPLVGGTDDHVLIERDDAGNLLEISGEPPTETWDEAGLIPKEVTK